MNNREIVPCAVLGLLFLWGCGSFVEFEYPDYATALREGQGTVFNLEKLLPTSATHIGVKRETNLGELWLRFQYSANPVPDWMTKVDSIGLSAVIGRGHASLATRTGWWPSPGRENAMVEFYRGVWNTQTLERDRMTGEVVLAVDPSARTAFCIVAPGRSGNQ